MYRKLIFLVLISLMLAGQGYAQVDEDAVLGAWLLDEGSGDVAADASGNGHDGTLMGSPDWVAGRFGTALAFSGSGTYVDCGNPDVFNVDVFSVSFWCNIPNIQYWNHMISRGSHVASGTPGSVNWGVMMYDQQETILYETFNDTGWVGISTPAAAGEWHHVVATLDVTAMQLYLDGALAGSASGGVLLDESRPFIIGARSDAGTPGGFFDGSLDDVGYFNAILTPEDIEALMNKGLAEVVGGPPVAGKPQPANGQTDVPRDPVLSWTAGKLAATHNVYFSDNLDEVSTGSPSVLIADGITETSVEPGRLTFESTYYWRVDEVNAAPDYAVFEGAVWSFTVEPFVYPIEGVIATSNGSSDAGAGPENTVNGSGLNANDEHSIAATDMWLTAPGTADPLWIQYEFDGLYKLHEMLVWNYNVQFELVLGFGLKDVTVEYSENGTDWTVLGDVELAQATATADYKANTTIDLQGVGAKFVRLNVNSGHGLLGQFGLSEVRFMFIPVVAREPQPADGATGVSPDAVLNWRAGREAGSHDVYLGTAPDALALADTVSTNSYTPADLAFGTAYYWKIDEVNEAEDPSVWASNVWTFSTHEYAVIEDFESYDDEENTIFDTWLDGFVNGTGSTVGYFEAPFAERSIVNSGAQSMPLEYNNAASPFYSEAEYDVGSMDLDTNGADTLRLFVSGQAPDFLETADGSILMNAIGNDIWDTADQFRYAYRTLTGDGSLTARVDYLDGSPNPWAKGGVMIRQSTEGGAINTYMAMTGGDGGGATYQQRMDADGASVSQHSYADGP
ncbi:MAG: LamG-like jellyroll fold domain-containing protein, partial [Planctomycetota bacterium]